MPSSSMLGQHCPLSVRLFVVAGVLVVVDPVLVCFINNLPCRGQGMKRQPTIINRIMVSLATLHHLHYRRVVDDVIVENDDYGNGDTVLATQNKMENNYTYLLLTYNRCE